MAWTWTTSEWHKQSKAGHNTRSSKFKAIETAIGRYNARSGPVDRIRSLKAMLDAIADWRTWKQDKKWKHTDKNNEKSYASSDESLREADVLGATEEFSIRGQVTDRLVRDIVEEVDDVLANERAVWGGFSDPAAHDPIDFTYLISAQTETPGTPSPWREKTIDNPDLIENALISASLVKNGNVHIWGPSGFVLAAPQNCIAVAARQDLAADNLAATKHAVEKYRETLALYLRQAGTPQGGLPTPANVLPGAYQHSEVVVLGKTYNSQTRVVGIYLVVDQAVDDVGGIRPATLWKQISRFTTGQSYQDVVEPMPCVTDERMQKYRRLQQDRGLPIVQIEVGGGVEVNGKYWDGFCGCSGFLEFKAATMVRHGSREHLELEAKAKEKGGTTKTVKDEKHACRICG